MSAAGFALRVVLPSQCTEEEQNEQTFFRQGRNDYICRCKGDARDLKGNRIYICLSSTPAQIIYCHTLYTL